jgi:hypothetical protein
VEKHLPVVVRHQRESRESECPPPHTPVEALYLTEGVSSEEEV